MRAMIDRGGPPGGGGGTGAKWWRRMLASTWQSKHPVRRRDENDAVVGTLMELRPALSVTDRAYTRQR